MVSKHLAIIGVIAGIMLMLLAGNNITNGEKSFWTIVEMLAGVGLFASCIAKIN